MTDTECNAYQLARMAGCSQPDSQDSPGGEWLRLVADTFADDLAGDKWNEDHVHEYADGLVPIYNHHRWQVLVDIAAYEEDTADLAGPGADMTQLAGIALYQVAERLLLALHVAEDSDE